MVRQPSSCLLNRGGQGGQRTAEFTLVRLGGLLRRHRTAVELVKHILPPLRGVVGVDLPTDGVEPHLPVGLLGVVAVDAVAVQKRLE
jgi:hypothetical protein